MKLFSLLLVTAVLCLIQNIKLGAQSKIPINYELVYSQDFDLPQAINDFEMTDDKAWRIVADNSGKSLELYGKSDYEGQVRSPFNIALIKDVVVGDFVFEAELSQTGREYGHRDLCLFFGATSSANFYYVHIASKADDYANNIFIVNDEPRKQIGTKTTEGTDWGKTDSWHKVRIEREVASGSIKVYFDDNKTPIMEATDVHFIEGHIGIGSFDDTGKFDNIKIWSNNVIEIQKGFFK